MNRSPAPPPPPHAGGFAESRPQVLDILRRWATQRGLARRRLLVVSAGEWTASIPEALGRDIELVHPGSTGLLDKPFSFARFEQRLAQQVASYGDRVPPLIAIDMDWVLLAPAAHANVSVWSASVDALQAATGSPVLCLYARRRLPERVLLAGLHAHPRIASAQGVRANPYHLPPEAAAPGAARARFDHWLARLDPDLRARHPAPADAQGSSTRLIGSGHDDATGDDTPDPDRTPPGERWKVRCFGALRLYREDGRALDWSVAGGASRKVRCILALLLLRGPAGAHADELVELLWPGTDASGTPRSRNRLHHTLHALRLALAPAPRAREHPYLKRLDDRYVLTPPPDTWVDVEDFEQLCRQGTTLLRDGRAEEALGSLESALRLYSGDLFEDLPPSFTESKDPDWCWSRRYWFREMYFKVHRDCAAAQRQLGRPLEAIRHCQAALQRDPACEMAHGELMRVLAAQGRTEALDRQYKLYRLAAADGADALDGLYRSLRKGLLSQAGAGNP
jgi:DNA-binding SARP family transcriptional activator